MSGIEPKGEDALDGLGGLVGFRGAKDVRRDCPRRYLRGRQREVRLDFERRRVGGLFRLECKFCRSISQFRWLERSTPGGP